MDCLFPSGTPSAGAAVLLCPCGGGTSLYRQWAALTGPQVHVCHVQLPGRENWIAESPFRNLDLILSALDDALSPFLDMPCAIFGHSFGALIGFELARRFAERKGLVPVHLFASSCRAPLVRRTPAPARLPSKAAFIAQIGDLGIVPRPILDNPEAR